MYQSGVTCLTEHLSFTFNMRLYYMLIYYLYMYVILFFKVTMETDYQLPTNFQSHPFFHSHHHHHQTHSSTILCHLQTMFLSATYHHFLSCPVELLIMEDRNRQKTIIILLHLIIDEEGKTKMETVMSEGQMKILMKEGRRMKILTDKYEI